MRFWYLSHWQKPPLIAHSSTVELAIFIQPDPTFLDTAMRASFKIKCAGSFHLLFLLQSKKDSKDQESIQSSITSSIPILCVCRQQKICPAFKFTQASHCSQILHFLTLQCALVSKLNVLAHFMYYFCYKVRKIARIRNRYNQVSHISQDTKWESNKITINITNKSQEVSPFPSGDSKTATNRRESMIKTRLIT